MRLLYIAIDSLRPDHLGRYGYARPTSPVIDSVAAQGVRLTEYFASDTPCVPSRADLFSGRPGIENGVVTHENIPAGSTLRYGPRERFGGAPLLMHALAGPKLHTVSFSSFADRHYAGWFSFSVREFRLPSLKGGNEDAPEVNAAVLPWLRAHAKKDGWFVYLNYWDVHTLYTEPLRYAAMMAAHPAPAWPDAEAIALHQGAVGLRTARTLWGEGRHEGHGHSRVPTMPDRIADRADFETLVNGYGPRFQGAPGLGGAEPAASAQGGAVTGADAAVSGARPPYPAAERLRRGVSPCPHLPSGYLRLPAQNAL